MSSPESPPADYLTPEQVAARFQVHERTVRRACDDGEIPGARQVRGLWRIPVESVDLWGRNDK